MDGVFATLHVSFQHFGFVKLGHQDQSLRDPRTRKEDARTGVGMFAHPVIPLPEVLAVAPALLHVHVVKHNKVSHPDLVLALSLQKSLGVMMGFAVRHETVSVPGSF